MPVLDAAAEDVTAEGDASEDAPPEFDPDLGDALWDATSKVDNSDEVPPKDAATPAEDGGPTVGAGDSSLADAAPDASQGIDAGNACNPDPCQHGGACSPTAQGASCDCAETGFTGTTCETDIDECASANSCNNAAYPCVQTEAPGYTCQGQFADWPMPDAVVGSKVKPSYDTTTVADVVIDDVTGLAWQKVPPSGTRSWEEARLYCQDLELGGSSDWRLPTKIELESIVDDTRRSPSINQSAFPDTVSGAFFTASPLVGPAIASPWVVEFNQGLTWPLEMDIAPGHVRCVRTARRLGSASATRYLFGNTAGRATVTDTRTGLVWERDLHPTQVDRAAARARCASLGGRWRLPTKKELLTLVDPTIDLATPPVIDLNAFPDTPAMSGFWSNSLAASTSSGWILSANGSTGTTLITQPRYVRCVH